MSKWYVWSVNVKYHRKISTFLKKIPQITDSLIPIMEKEYYNKSGKKKMVKEIPLYGNYIFLKYDDDPEVFNILNSNQLFYRFLGECTDEEACRIEEFKHRNYREFLKEDDLEPGMKVKLVTEPFKGLVGMVKSVSGKNVCVLLEFFGQPVEIRCKIDDLRTELWTASEGD